METDIKLIDYSEKAIAIATEYDCALQDEFKLIGGRFNSRLSFGADLEESALDVITVLYTDDTFNQYTESELQAAISEEITNY